MKPQFTFYFTDEPQFACKDLRYKTARLLWTYRNHKDQYDLKRLGLHRYSVQNRYSGTNNPVAIIELRA